MSHMVDIASAHGTADADDPGPQPAQLTCAPLRDARGSPPASPTRTACNPIHIASMLSGRSHRSRHERIPVALATRRTHPGLSMPRAPLV